MMAVRRWILAVGWQSGKTKPRRPEMSDGLLSFAVAVTVAYLIG
jgi:hypothetical protein